MMDIKLEDARAEVTKAKKTNDLVVKKLKEKHAQEIKKFKEVKEYSDINDEDARLDRLKKQLIEKNQKIVDL
jgi:hypothetical protein